MKIRNLGHWGKDYLRDAHTLGVSLLYKKPPEHFLGFKKENKAPIILIPGLLNSWHSLRQIGNKLSLEGHPVYVLEKLGRNTKEISVGAKILDELIQVNTLKDVIIVAHSKGGLIAKYFLAFHENASKVKKIITIATPFAGSKIVQHIPFKTHRELHPSSEVIRQISDQKHVNHKIVSIYGIFDNHVWPISSSHLEGAKNIEVDVAGHHSILFDKKVIGTILNEINL